MVEFEKEPDYTGMAMDTLGLSFEERIIIQKYCQTLLLCALNFNDNPENNGKIIIPEEIITFADSKFPNDLEIIKKVWEKSIELAGS